MKNGFFLILLIFFVTGEKTRSSDRPFMPLTSTTETVFIIIFIILLSLFSDSPSLVLEPFFLATSFWKEKKTWYDIMQSTFTFSLCLYCIVCPWIKSPTVLFHTGKILESNFSPQRNTPNLYKCHHKKVLFFAADTHNNTKTYFIEP